MRQPMVYDRPARKMITFPSIPSGTDCPAQPLPPPKPYRLAVELDSHSEMSEHAKENKRECCFCIFFTGFHKNQMEQLIPNKHKNIKQS